MISHYMPKLICLKNFKNFHIEVVANFLTESGTKNVVCLHDNQSKSLPFNYDDVINEVFNTIFYGYGHILMVHLHIQFTLMLIYF